MSLNVDGYGQKIFDEDEFANLKYSNPELFHLLNLSFHDLDSSKKAKLDWSIKHLIEIVLRVITHIQQTKPFSNIVLVGHSMGGSVAIQALNQINNNKSMVYMKEAIVGLMVIDVVEGTALEALPHMHVIVKNK